MNFIVIESDLSVLGLKLGLSRTECIRIMNQEHHVSGRLGYNGIEYFNGGMGLLFSEEDILVAIEFFSTIEDNMVLVFEEIPLFKAPREVIIEILRRKLGMDSVNTSGNEFVVVKKDLVLWTELVFDYEILEDPGYKEALLENKILQFQFLFLMLVRIGNI